MKVMGKSEREEGTERETERDGERQRGGGKGPFAPPVPLFSFRSSSCCGMGWADLASPTDRAVPLEQRESQPARFERRPSLFVGTTALRSPLVLMLLLLPLRQAEAFCTLRPPHPCHPFRFRSRSPSPSLSSAAPTPDLDRLIDEIRNLTAEREEPLGEAEAEALRSILMAENFRCAEDEPLGKAEVEALRSIFMAGKVGRGDEESREAVRTSMKGKERTRSSAVRGAKELAFELRSFLRSMRNEVEVLQGRASDRARSDIELALSAADYLARRVLLDSAALLSSAASAASSTLRLGAAAPSSAPKQAATAKETAAPFATRVKRLASALALSASDETGSGVAGAAPQLGGDQLSIAIASGGLELSLETRTYLTDDKSEVAQKLCERRQQLATEGSLLARDGWSALCGWLLVVDRIGAGADAQSGASTPPPAQSLPARARTVGSLIAESVQEAAGEALRATRADAAAYATLRRMGRLPTIAEEIRDVTPVIPAQLAEIIPPRVGGNSGMLGAFALQGSPRQQRAARLQRREREASIRQLALARVMVERASKDGSDVFVAGVLPAMRAIGKVAAGRAIGALPRVGAQGVPINGGGDVARELAETLRQEYMSMAAQMRKSSPMGKAFDEAVSGTTKRISRGFESASTMLPARRGAAARTAGSDRAGRALVAVDGVQDAAGDACASVPRMKIAAIGAGQAALAVADLMPLTTAGTMTESVERNMRRLETAAGETATEMTTRTKAAARGTSFVVQIDGVTGTMLCPTEAWNAPDIAPTIRAPRQDLGDAVVENARSASVFLRQSETLACWTDVPLRANGMGAEEADVLDVEAVVEPDQENHTRQKLLAMVDGALFMAELQAEWLISMARRAVSAALPEVSRRWTLLPSYFREDDVVRRQRQAEASQQFIEALIEAIGRD